MSLVVQSQISTSNPSSSIRPTRSTKRQVGEHHLGADGQPERPHRHRLGRSARATGAWVWTDSMQARAIGQRPARVARR